MPDSSRATAEWIASVERRLHALATAPRANKTSVRNGYTRWLTPDEDLPVVQIGSTVEDGGDVALQVADEDGATRIYAGTNEGRARFDLYNAGGTSIVLSFSDGLLRAPMPSCAWVRYVGNPMDAVGMSTTTSGTYVDLWYSVLAVGDDSINSVIDVVPDAGTTGDVRIMALVVGGVSTGPSSGGSQQVVEQTGITVSTVVQGPWTVPPSVWSPASAVSGAVLLLTVQGRRTAGGGSVHVAPRYPVYGS